MMLQTEPHAWPGSHSRPEDASRPGQPLCPWVVAWWTVGRAGWRMGWPRHLGQSLGPLKPWMRLILSCSAGSHGGWSLLATHQPRLFSRLPTPSPSPSSFSGFGDSAMRLPKPARQNRGECRSTVAGETSSPQHPLWVKGRPALVQASVHCGWL